jgi:Domain of unknown function (DUF4304)
MTRGIASRINQSLAPLGFERREAAWNRKRSGLIDVVSMQVEGAIEKLTVEAGVLHPTTYATCWGEDVPDFVDVPDCTVRARVGHLIDKHDLWWPLDQPGVAEDVVDKIASYLLPYLDRHQSVEAIEKSLAASGPVKVLRPPDTVYLAILMRDRGDATGACALLAQVHKKALGDWKPKAAELLQRLGCQSSTV